MSEDPRALAASAVIPEAGPEFSPRTRSQSLKRFDSEIFDLLVIGGGITGAACARDAASRGMKVALIEKSDFASGTSSRSSKLIHGGLRYLENREFGLVFEALSERSLLLKTAPHMVRPLPFYFPVYKGDPHGRFILGLGMLLYDLLAVFRTPGMHRRLSRAKFLHEIPFLRQPGLKGGFQYYDASMWDDALAIEVMRAAQTLGAACVNYVEATQPIWEEGRITGFQAMDLETSRALQVRASRIVIAAGPWTDLLGKQLEADWKPWLKPSKGVHLVFDLKRIPVPGALVMSHPEDGRISFVMPRPDLGAGVTIVGTTDGPTPTEPEKAGIDPADVEYLLQLLNRYFEPLKITASDILSTYVGVRPLVNTDAQKASGGTSLAKVSREHEIRLGPGGVTLIAGGKYTTHRKMAEEIVDFSLAHSSGHSVAVSNRGDTPRFGRSSTRTPVNPLATSKEMFRARDLARSRGVELPGALIDRYGSEALDIARIQIELKSSGLAVEKDPEGFPWLGAQLVHQIRSGMVQHLEDFWFRRAPLFLSRSDHGLPWVDALSRIWAQELARTPSEAAIEAQRLREEISRHEAWRLPKG